MGKSLKYFCGLLLLLFVSCYSAVDKQDYLLQRADSLIRIRQVDSALNLLEDVQSQELTTPAVRAKYAVLLTQAKDKNYILHTDDSLIRTAVSYYDSVGDIAMQAKSHYYLGRVHQDMKDGPFTIKEFLIAMPLAEMAKDYDLICLLQANLGDIYYQQDLYNEADSLYQCAEQFVAQRNDSVRLVTVLSQRGKICIEKGEEYYASAENYLKRALVIAEDIENPITVRNVSSLLASLYSRIGDSSKALFYSRLALSLQEDSTKVYGIYLTLGTVYYKTAQYDSALFYLMKSLHSTNYYTKAGVYMRLADIAIAQGRADDAIIFENHYRSYIDSTKKMKQAVGVVISAKDFKMQQVTQEYESFLYRYKYYIYGLLVLLLLVFSYLIYRRAKFRLQMMVLTEEHKKKLWDATEQLDRLEQAVVQKDSEIVKWQLSYIECDGDKQKLAQWNSCLNELLTEKRKLCDAMKIELVKREFEIEELKWLIDAEDDKKDVARLNERLDILQKERKRLFENVMATSPIYKKLMVLIDNNFKNPDSIGKFQIEDWTDLVTEIDRISLGFTTRLNHKYERLLAEDIHFSCLVKIGLSPTEMALVFGCTSNAVYKRRESILKRMQMESSVLKFEDLIEDI